MSNIWLISDTHFNHANIINFKDRITGELVRGQFSSVDEMNECMLDKWNETVKDGDTVIHCGDVLFGMDKVAWMEANFAKLPGKKKLVLGNHDNVKQLAPFFKEIVLWSSAPGIVCTHTPLHAQTLNEGRWEEGVINVHGHIHTNPSPEGPYKCVSVEQINYTPINIEELI